MDNFSKWYQVDGTYHCRPMHTVVRLVDPRLKPNNNMTLQVDEAW